MSMPPLDQNRPVAPVIEPIEQPARIAPETVDPAALMDGMYRAEAGNLTRYFDNRLRGDDEPADYVQEVFARLAGHLSGQPSASPTAICGASPKTCSSSAAGG
jgi:RNA polymerase sigma-70 factor (ECF subfamily)